MDRELPCSKNDAKLMHVYGSIGSITEHHAYVNPLHVLGLSISFTVGIVLMHHVDVQ